jgi:hypothetical protein
VSHGGRTLLPDSDQVGCIGAFDDHGRSQIRADGAIQPWPQHWGSEAGEEMSE